MRHLMAWKAVVRKVVRQRYGPPCGTWVARSVIDRLAAGIFVAVSGRGPSPPNSGQLAWFPPRNPVESHRDAGRTLPGRGRPCRASSAAGHDRAGRGGWSDRALAAGLAFRSVQDPRRCAGRRAGRGSPGWSDTPRSGGGTGMPHNVRGSAVQPSGRCASSRSCRARSGGAGGRRAGARGRSGQSKIAAGHCRWPSRKIRSLNALPQERMVCQLRPRTPRRAWPSALGQDSVVRTSRDATPSRAGGAGGALGGLLEDRIVNDGRYAVEAMETCPIARERAGNTACGWPLSR